MEPYYEADGITIYHGEALEVLGSIEGSVDAVLTDPPYPNRAGHFVDAIEAAEEFCRTFTAPHWLVFWDELTRPPVPHPLVAVHIWHRTNSNRPDNYEPIYEFAAGGRKASRCYGYPVVHPGLTGCKEATGHPTQKSERLMHRLVSATSGTVLDPFMGSGSTLVAAHHLGRAAIGVEVEERYCEIAAKRLAQGVLDLGGAA